MYVWMSRYHDWVWGRAYDLNQPALSCPVHIMPYYDSFSSILLIITTTTASIPAPKEEDEAHGRRRDEGLPSISFGQGSRARNPLPG